MIVQSVAVGIGVERIGDPCIGTPEHFLVIGDTVVVRIIVHWIGVVELQFKKIREPVTIRVRIQGICMMSENFIPVLESVAVRVRIQGICIENKDLVIIVEPVPVRVRVIWIRVVVHYLGAVIEPVTVRIGIQRVRGVKIVLLPVAQSVLVAVLGLVLLFSLVGAVPVRRRTVPSVNSGIASIGIYTCPARESVVVWCDLETHPAQFIEIHLGPGMTMSLPHHPETVLHVTRREAHDDPCR